MGADDEIARMLHAKSVEEQRAALAEATQKESEASRAWRELRETASAAIAHADAAFHAWEQAAKEQSDAFDALYDAQRVAFAKTEGDA